jgi:hypothetical protein
MKKVKKPTIPKLRKKAFKLWSEIVRKDGKCEICGCIKGTLNAKGKPVILHAHHLIGRENHALMFDIQNGISLCVGHHKYFKDSAHKGGLVFHDWFMKKYPERYNYLLINAANQVDLNIQTLQEIIKQLEELNK